MPSLPNRAFPPRSPPSPTRLRGAIADADLPFYRRSRALVYAVGIAVIASSGALLGAQLKTVWQDWNSTHVAELGLGGGSADNKTGTATAVATAATATAQKTSAQGKSATAPVVAATTTPEKTKEEVKADLKDLERSITTLQNRRGQLVQRRMQEEGRLAGLRERIAKRSEVREMREKSAGAGDAGVGDGR